MATTDTRILLIGLRAYQKHLERHLQVLRTEFNVLESRWQALNAVYTGEAADEFKAHWAITRARFQEYQDRTARILDMLKERIEALEEFDRPGGL